MAIEPKIIIYDAYVCYADKDIGFVEQLSQYLESPNVSNGWKPVWKRDINEMSVQ